MPSITSRLLGALLALLLASPAAAQMALRGSQFACATPGNLFAGGTTYTYTYPAAVTNGDLVVLAVDTEIRTVSSIAGTATTYTINDANTGNGAAGRNLSIWKAIAAGADTTATITISGNTSSTAYVCFAEFTNANSDQSSSVGTGASFDATSGAGHNSGTVTPPSANNVVVAAIGRTPGTWTEDTGFTNITSADSSFNFGYILQTAATAQEYNASSVDPEYSEMRIGAFAGTGGGGGGGGSNSQLFFFGVGTGR